MSINRAVDTDDDGTGTTGTIHDNAWLQNIYATIDGRWSELTTTSTGTQNNFSITSGGLEADVLRCNNASLLTLNGIAAPASPAKPGKPLIVVSVGAGQVDIANQNASSTAANRIINNVTGTISLAAGWGRALLVYDDTTDRWRVIHHDQGAWITPTFAAGTYTASGAQTWTVASGDVTTQAYWLRGRTMSVRFTLDTTTVGGTPSTDLYIGNAAWGSLTATKAMYGYISWMRDNDVLTTGICNVAASGTNVVIRRADLGNFTASANLTYAYGGIDFEVS